jgi:hypothetical protein
MKSHLTPFFFMFLVAGLISGCSKNEQPETPGIPTVFEPLYTRFDLSENLEFSFRFEEKIAPQIGEASGVVSGRKNPGLVYMHEDSGNRNVVFVYDTLGQLVGEWVLVGIGNRDWEDIAIGPGPEAGETYIYVGDIGDNRGVRDFINIYRFPEPEVPSGAQQTPFKTNISNVETIRVKYPDGPRDAETLMIDPKTKDLVIVTKREVQVHVYQLPYPQKVDGTETPIFFRGKLPFRTITAGDISPDGSEIMIKDYGTIYHWNTTSQGIVSTLFLQEPTRPAYIPEVQGEALGWSYDGNGYFTITEIENHQVDALLRYFSR